MFVKKVLRKKYFRIVLLYLSFFSLCTFSQRNVAGFFEISNQKQLDFQKEFKKNNAENNRTLSKNYKKFVRWQWFWQNRVDKKGDLAAYNKEIFAPGNVQKLREHAILNIKNEDDWKIVGPETYPEGTNPNGIKGIGRIDAIVVNPNNKNHVIIGARSGGIWETYTINNPFPTWVCLTNNLPVSTVNDLKIINNTLYAATSNKNAYQAQGDSKYGLGIIKKSLDTNVWELPNTSFESKNIAVSKKNPNILYAVGEKHSYKSTDAGGHWEKLSDPVANIKNSKLFLTNIEVNPFDANKIIITGRLNIYDSTNNKQVDVLIFKSENGGKSWINLTSDLEKFINTKFKATNAKDSPISLTKGKKNQITTYTHNEKLFLCLQEMHSQNRVYFVTLDEKWKNFSLFNSRSKNNTYYYKTDNVDVRFQVINGSEIIIGNRKLRIIKNDKHTITALDNGYKDLHQDIRAINYDKERNKLILGTDGGINIGFDKNSDLLFPSFSNASGNLNLFLAFNMSYINNNSTRTIRIGNQDTGYYRADNTGEKWNNWKRFGPFGEGLVYTHSINPNIVYLINAGGHGGNVLKSIDGGKNFTNTKIKAGNYVFAPFAIHPTNTNKLLFDNFVEYDQYTLSLSNNQTKTAIPIANGITKLDKGMNLALAISKKNPAVFYVARKDFHLKTYGINNSLFKSENLDFKNPEKITYTDITANINAIDTTILKTAFITDIEISDTNEKELWITFGNLEKGKKIYHSSDGGLNWENISANLPNVPVNVVEFDTINNQLYIGNDYGVYNYNSKSKTWGLYGKGLPVAIVTSIAIDTKENEIIAATHGRSVWLAPLIKNTDHIITTHENWTEDKTISGDLIIKSGASLLLSNATLKTHNIVLQDNAILNVFNGKIISNYKNDKPYFNTSFIVNSASRIAFSNAEIHNYTINMEANSAITFYGSNYNKLQHVTINIFANANYYQNTNSKIVLEDTATSLLFHTGYILGNTPNATELNKINFSGNGNIKLINKK